MAQIKIYGLRSHLDGKQHAISDAIHGCVVEALDYPVNKRAHRFIKLDADDFFYPEGRSDQYTIIEISMFEGRSVAAKKRLIHLLIEALGEQMQIAAQDVEITIFETPRRTSKRLSLHNRPELLQPA
jgi:hypothetical protein